MADPRPTEWTMMKDEMMDQIIESRNFDLVYEQWPDLASFDSAQNKALFGSASDDVIKYIIDNLEDIEVVCAKGYRIMHYVCRYRSLAMVKYMVEEKKASTECETIKGERPIHFVCKYQDEDTARYFIDLGVDLDCETKTGKRPIHYLCGTDVPDLIIYMIFKGIDIRCSYKKQSLLYYFYLHESLPLIKLLVDRTENLLPEEIDRRLLKKVLGFQSSDVVDHLLEQDVNLLDVLKFNNVTVFHLICQNNQLETIKKVLDKRGCSWQWTDSLGRTPIHYICKFQNKQVIEYFADKEVEWHSRDSRGHDAAYFIFKYQKLDVIKYFVKNMFTQNINDYSSTSGTGWTYFHLVCRYQPLDVIQFIMESFEVNLAAEGPNGWKPEHLVCAYQPIDAINYIFNKILSEPKNCRDITTKVSLYNGRKCSYGIVELMKLNPLLKKSK